MPWKPFIFLLIFLLLSAAAIEPSARAADPPSLLASLQSVDSVEFCGEKVPVERQSIRERLEKELLLSLGDRPQVILWLKRSRRYLPLISRMFSRNKLPEDLKFVAVAESALRPHVRSSKGAVGFWQFMAGTGRKYGLTVNSRIDERRNFFAATRAAGRYFRDLHSMFDSWTLAVAAYNMGEKGLQAEIMEQGADDYYQLYLPLETQRFIFRILAVKIILADPDKYGFHLSEEDYYPPLKFDRVKIDLLRETPVRVLAQAAKTSFKNIKDLNPEIRGHYLVEGSRKLILPAGMAQGFEKRLHKFEKQYAANRKERIYVVRKGDNLSAIAARFNIPLTALLISNRLDPRKAIHPGDRLVVYPKSKTLQ